MFQYDMPLCEIVLDFHDALKSITSGYASFDYEDNGFQASSILKVCFDITIYIHGFMLFIF